MENLKHRLAIVTVFCFVFAGFLFRMAVNREADKNLVTRVPVGEGIPQARITVNTDKSCYFELTLSILLSAAPSDALGDVAAPDAAFENPLGHVVSVKYTVLDADGREILAETHEYSVSEFRLESPITATLSALQPSRLGRFVKIKPPGHISIQTSMVESDALAGFQFQSTYGGVSVWENTLPRAGALKLSAVILISIGLLALAWIGTEFLKDFF